MIVLLAGNEAHAEDSVATLMHRAQSERAVRIAYQETRQLELMAQPWQGSGFMYSLPPDVMIKEQLRPERLLMGVKGSALFYFDPVNDIRHQAEMDEDSPFSLNIGVFKALIHGDEALLHSLYQVDFASESDGWTMTLNPRQVSESGFTMTIFGLPSQQADRIVIQQADGDLSTLTLGKEAAGDAIKATVIRMYQELLGE